MKLHRIRALLLLAAVLIGQWLSFAHATQHQSLEAAAAVCDYCVSGIGSAPPATPGEHFTLAQFASEAPRQTLASFASSTHQQLLRIRGPPSLLV